MTFVLTHRTFLLVNNSYDSEMLQEEYREIDLHSVTSAIVPLQISEHVLGQCVIDPACN